jgi:RimJ/RimL family protein N-acetyltransferase
MTTLEFETERLLLRRFSLADIEDFFELGSDPDVIRYAQPRPFADLDEARRFMQEAPLTDYEKYGYGRLAVILKQTDELIGFCGIKHLPQLGMDELGYRFKTRHWGKGYATEAGAATLAHARDELALKTIIALVLDGNEASANVARKLGMKFRSYVDFEDERPKLFEISLTT